LIDRPLIEQYGARDILETIMKWLILALCWVAASGNAWGDGLIGSDILKYCTTDGDGFDRAICFGYVTGVIAATEVWEHWKNLDSGICIPQNSSPEQLRIAVAKYLKQHPQDLHFEASALVLTALFQAFPCRDKPPESSHDG